VATFYLLSLDFPKTIPIFAKKSEKVDFQKMTYWGLIIIILRSEWSYNESKHLEASFEKYRSLFGFYPREVLADRIYCTRDNRKMLKGKGSGILLRAKPLGRPSILAVLML